VGGASIIPATHLLLSSVLSECNSKKKINVEIVPPTNIQGPCIKPTQLTSGEGMPCSTCSIMMFQRHWKLSAVSSFANRAARCLLALDSSLGARVHTAEALDDITFGFLFNIRRPSHRQHASNRQFKVLLNNSTVVRDLCC
jgi:hypothetical protein